ncbi:MAG TPA: DegT/DnrJ/EryC1/StrS family aminotransferase [Pirellulales bacterium]|jgi:dTDP-4-amino-4,6-dideoxygalactose transaminase|nr:DegT/DnrJ/EryC1/StrS family aminotransferase [Pirellulales bacterium]
MSDPTQLAPQVPDGRDPVLPDGPPKWPPDDPDVRDALEAALDDGSWGQYFGKHVARLSGALAELFGLPYAYPCCSGTFAVELALRSLPVEAGDEVLLAGYDFPGNFRAIEAIGARPVLVDVDPLNWNLDYGQLSNAVGPRTRAVVVSHLHGGLVRMSGVLEAAAPHGLAVVEDVCQAPGAIVEGRLAGTWGDVAVLSFGGSKLLTAGRGGAILTRRPDVHQRAKVFCEQGNHAFPLSELQAAVLLPQLAKLPGRNSRRLAAVERLVESLHGLRSLRPLQNLPDSSVPAFYKLGFRYDAVAAGRSRADFIAAAQAEGVAIDAGFRGFVLRGEKRCRVSGDLSGCRLAAESALVLHHPVLLEPDETIDHVAAALLKAADAQVVP